MTDIDEHFPDVLSQTFPLAILENAIKNAERSNFTHYHTCCRNAAKEAEKDGKLQEAQGLELIAQVLSMGNNLESNSEPFHPMWRMGNTRSAIHTDFTDANLSVIKHVLSKSTIPLLKARLADVLWWREKKWSFAEIAIQETLTFAESHIGIEHQDWLDANSLAERAAQLWTMTGRKSDIRNRFIEIYVAALDFKQPEPENFYRIILLQTVVKYGFTDDAKSLISNVEQLAINCESNARFDKAQSYFEIAIDLARMAGDKSKEKLLRAAHADSFLRELEYVKGTGASKLFLSHYYDKAIEACRRIGGRREIIDRLHQELNEIRLDGLDELKEMSVPIKHAEDIFQDGKDVVRKAGSLENALVQLALMARPYSKRNLEDEGKKSISAAPLASMFSTLHFDDKGRVVKTSGGSFSTDGSERDAALYAEMVKHESFRQQLVAGCRIEGARQAINEMYFVERKSFFSFLSMNPFVGPDRILSFSKGLLAGLDGDWITCANVLVPQLENSLRNVLERSGMLVTLMKADHSQTEYDLNTLLYENEANQVLGEDLVFMLRVLLVDKLGFELRNKVAHGRLSDGHFGPAPINYVWASTLYLCFAYQVHLKELRRQTNSEENGQTVNDDPVENDDSETISDD